MKTYRFIWVCLSSIITLLGIIYSVHFLETANKDSSEKKIVETRIDLAESTGITEASDLAESTGITEASDLAESTGITETLDLAETIEMSGKSTEVFTDKVKGNRWEIILEQEEKELLSRIIMLEAGGESELGQQAVVEVILNRMYSPLFPDTVYEVLSQEVGGVVQFTSWKNRNQNKAEPTQQVINSINAVLDGKTNILPYETVYFSVEGENHKVETVIGNHVFCN